MTAARRKALRRARTTGRGTASRTPSARTRGTVAKKVAKRVVKKAARKAAKKAVNKKAVRKVAKQATRKVVKASAKKTTRKTARPTVRRAAPNRTPRAAKAAAAFTPTAFATQRSGAVPRDLLLFELVRARAAVKAALQGVASGRALQPIAPGKWNLLEIVLHLSERDRVRLEEFERLLAGVPPSWRGLSLDELAAVNEAHLAPLRAHTWDEALRRMDALRDELMERLARVAADEAAWRKGHAFADTMGHLSQHDRHHAQQIKLARIGS